MSTPAAAQPYTMTAELAQRVSNYLGNKPYKVSKPIMDGLREVKADNGDILYQMDVNTVVHLLDNVMLNEEDIRTFMLLRVGYDNLMRRAQAIPSVPRETPTEADARDNVSEEPVEPAESGDTGAPGAPGSENEDADAGNVE